MTTEQLAFNIKQEWDRRKRDVQRQTDTWIVVFINCDFRTILKSYSQLFPTVNSHLK